MPKRSLFRRNIADFAHGNQYEKVDYTTSVGMATS